eukprot:310957-Hanusia_phi.AAC.1
MAGATDGQRRKKRSSRGGSREDKEITVSLPFRLRTHGASASPFLPVSGSGLPSSPFSPQLPAALRS